MTGKRGSQGDRVGTSGREIRDLARRLAEAPDADVARAVAVVDQLPMRGGADRLIEPVRPRLASLRPPRPLRFTRLLFLPLEPLIVPPPHWQPRLPTIPRSALAALAATVRSGLGSERAEIDVLLHMTYAHNNQAVARAGDLLWPRAAALLSAAPPSLGWAETGLNPTLYPGLARRIGAVLAQASLVQQLIAEAEAGIAPPRQAPIRIMLDRVTTNCPEAQGMLMALLLARLPQLAAVLPGIVAEFGAPAQAALRQASSEAAEALLAGLEATGGTEIAVAGVDLADAGQAVRRAVTLMQQLAERADLPKARPRVQAIRQRLDASCRQRFSQALASDFLPSLRRKVQGAETATALEATARHLRELESEARIVGGGDSYDSGLRAAAEAVLADDVTMNLAARIRLVEILAGSEAAMALLDRRVEHIDL